MEGSNLVTGNFTLNAQMANGKTMSIGGYMYEDESIESVNQRVSLMHDALDFQRKRSEIPDLEAKREQMLVQITNMRDALIGLQQKEEAGVKLSTSERQQIKNMLTSIEKAEAEVIKGEKIIADAKTAVGLT